VLAITLTREKKGKDGVRNTALWIQSNCNNRLKRLLVNFFAVFTPPPAERMLKDIDAAPMISCLRDTTAVADSRKPDPLSRLSLPDTVWIEAGPTKMLSIFISAHVRSLSREDNKEKSLPSSFRNVSARSQVRSRRSSSNMRSLCCSAAFCALSRWDSESANSPWNLKPLPSSMSLRKSTTSTVRDRLYPR
jgi:hypothetical protein